MNIKLGNCKELLKDLPDNSISSVCTDPPYELAMMGRSWDNTGIAYDKEMWAECLRVLKPGGHLLSFSHARTYHRIACAIEDSGFDLRDQIMWLYQTGMPKSGGLKPCHEPICVARKPFKGSAANLMRIEGVGSFYIDNVRVPITDPQDLADFENNHRVTQRIPLDRKDSSLNLFEGGWKQMVGEAKIPDGRYPGNIVLTWEEDTKWKGNISWFRAYMFSLRKTVTTLTKGSYSYFIMENIEHFIKPDYSYFKHLINTLEI